MNKKFSQLFIRARYRNSFGIAVIIIATVGFQNCSGVKGATSPQSADAASSSTPVTTSGTTSTTGSGSGQTTPAPNQIPPLVQNPPLIQNPAPTQVPPSSTMPAGQPNAQLKMPNDVNGNALVAGRAYFIKSSNSIHCIDVTGGNISNGTAIQQYDCLTAAPNQIWIMNPNGDGSLSFSINGKCLDIAADQLGTGGAKAQVWTCSGNPNQSFLIQEVASNTYQMKPMADTSQCFDIDSTHVNDDGATVSTWDCSTGTNQNFVFVPQSKIFPDPPMPIAPPKPAATNKYPSGCDMTQNNHIEIDGAAYNAGQGNAHLIKAASGILGQSCSDMCRSVNATICTQWISKELFGEGNGLAFPHTFCGAYSGDNLPVKAQEDAASSASTSSCP